MNKNNPIPTPEQQEEARNRLLTLIKQRQQAQPIPDHDEAAEAAQYASDADEYAAEAARQQKAREQREQAAAFKPDDVQALMVLREESDNENAQLRAALQASEAAKDAALQVAAQYINETKAAQQQAERTKTVAIAIGQRAAQLQTERVAERARIATEHASQIADVSMAALARSGTQASQITDAVLEAMTKAQELPKVQFSELVKDYEDNKTGLTDSSKNQYLKAARAFMSTMGDMYICDISRKTIREFLDIENDMPPNKNGSNRFKNLSRREAAEINKKEEGKTVDIKTSTEHVLKVQAFFTWGLENSANPDKWGFTKYGNPCRKCKDNIFTADEREMLESTTKTRRIFSNEDLTKLFTGKMRSIDRLYGYGIKRFRGRYHYWLPLLALFTGARANELAQLRLSDIVEKDGIMCIDINAGEDIDGMRRKSTKTVKTSVRLVPIHSDLIALGFL
ncbi:MAG: hypothetical protein RR100_07380, partial [Comamonas sp.]